ncbi:MAG TPA: methyltransferase domain-containing protein [Planktothrix sp.]|jgi:2-polyprenyl-3-methyl-5-hydroxy-6-metoxy-1,4-benzoquinol methylase
MLNRMREAELMDDPNLDEHKHVEALRSLARLNAVSSSASILWQAIRRMARRRKLNKLRILDIATGGGDLPVQLIRYAENDGIELQILAVDKSPTALTFGRNLAKQHSLEAQIDFAELDVFVDDLPADYDVITCSLFIHHLDPEQAISLFNKMRLAAKRLVVVNDLLRSQLSYRLVWLGARLLSQSPVVRFDSTASVRAAFTTEEMRDMAMQSGMSNCAVTYRFPCRQLLVWSPNADDSIH